MEFNDLLKGKKVKYMTDAKVEVILEISDVEEKRNSRDLEPATRENDWYPRTEDWITIEVLFTSGFKKTYSSLTELLKYITD